MFPVAGNIFGCFWIFLDIFQTYIFSSAIDAPPHCFTCDIHLYARWRTRVWALCVHGVCVCVSLQSFSRTTSRNTVPGIFLLFVIRFIKSNLPAVKYLNSCWPGLQRDYSYSSRWLWTHDNYNVFVLHTRTGLTLLCLLFVVVCYVTMFVRYINSARSSSNSTLSVIQLFRKSK